MRKLVLLSVLIVCLVWGGSFLNESLAIIRTSVPAGKAVPPEGRLRHALASRDWSDLAGFFRGLPYGRIFSARLALQTLPFGLLIIVAGLTAFYLLLRRPAASRLEQSVLAGVVGPASAASVVSHTDCSLWPRWSSAFRRHLPAKAGTPTDTAIRRHYTSAPPASSAAAARSGFWLAAGLIVVVASFCMMERIESYYFVQSDVFIAEFPGILQGCRTIAGGAFPDWNPSVVMGTPAAGAGLYSLLYPPMYLSYAIARWGLRDEFATMEVFAAMHLAGGFLASFAAARSIGIRPSLAFVLGISFILSGYMLFNGRSVHTLSPNAVWLPLMLLSVQRWIDGRLGWKWLFGTSLVIAALYYVGFPQFWFYALFLLAVAVAVVVICRRVPARRLGWLVAACLLGISMCLPLLVVQLEITRGMATKSPGAGGNLSDGILAGLLPYPLTALEQTQQYYCGTILFGCCYLACGALIAYRWSRVWLGKNPWIISSLVALWLGLGKAGGLWIVFGMLPVIKTTNHYPHRLFPFFIFFGFLTGGLFLERVLGSGLQSRKWERLIALIATVLMLYNVWLARDAIFCFGDRPYPPLPHEIAQRLAPPGDASQSRVWYCGPGFSRLPGFCFGLPMAIASAYDAYSFNGYDPIGEFRPETVAARQRLHKDPVAACRAFGIRWVTAPNPDYYGGETAEMAAINPYFVDLGTSQDLDPIRKAALSCLREKTTLVYEIGNVAPMAFDESRAAVGLPLSFDGRGAVVDVPGDGERTVVVNVLARPWLHAFGNGRSLVAAPDDWGRLRISVPDGVQRVVVRCQFDWGRGIVLGLVLAAATLGVFLYVVKSLRLPGGGLLKRREH